jgi:hypothetical protein
MTRKTLALALAMIAAPAWAQPSGAYVAGNLVVSGSANVVTNVGLGVGTTTAAETCSIMAGSNIGGSANVHGSAIAQTQVALSSGASARTEVGTIDGAQVMGSANVNGAVGAATAVTFMPGSSTCVSVGSVAPGLYGGVGTSAGAGAVLAVDLGYFITSHVNIGSVGRPC